MAAACVAEKWQEIHQLNSRRIDTGVDVESEMQRAFQAGLDTTTEIFGCIGHRVRSEVKAGGQREQIGRRALPHIEDAMAAMKTAISTCDQHCAMHECMDKIDAVFVPLHRAYDCLVSSPSD